MQARPVSDISIATHDSTSNTTPAVNREVFQLNSNVQPVQNINAITNIIENNLQESR